MLNYFLSYDSYLSDKYTGTPFDDNWKDVNEDELPLGFNYEFDRGELNNKIRNIAKINGYKNIINEDFIPIYNDQQYFTDINHDYNKNSMNSSSKYITRDNNDENNIKINGNKNIRNTNLLKIKKTIGSGMSAKTIDTSKISMQEFIILCKNKIVKKCIK